MLLHLSLGLVTWYCNTVWPGNVLQNYQKLYSTLYNKVSVLCSKFWMWYRSVARVMEMVCSKLWYVVLQCLNHGAVWPGGNVVFKVFNSDALYCTTFLNIVPHPPTVWPGGKCCVTKLSTLQPSRFFVVLKVLLHRSG